MDFSKRVSTGEAGKLLGVDASQVRRYISEGRLPATRTPGGHARVRLADVQRLRERRSTKNESV